MASRTTDQPQTFDEYPKTFNVRDNINKVNVLMECVPLTRDLAKTINLTWWTDSALIKDAKKSDSVRDGHWNWVKTWGDCASTKGSGYLRGWAACTSDGGIQGAIIYWTNRFSFLERQKGEDSIRAVYVDRLATAPRNRPDYVKTKIGRFSGVGTGLLNLAVAHSYFLNGGGRTLLHAFDRNETVEWYEHFGLIRTDVRSEGTILMELPARTAMEKIQRLRLK